MDTVNFKYGVQEGLPNDRSPDTFYATTDTGRLYLGDNLLGESLDKLNVGNNNNSTQVNPNGKLTVGEDNFNDSDLGTVIGSGCATAPVVKYWADASTYTRISDLLEGIGDENANIQLIVSLSVLDHVVNKSNTQDILPTDTSLDFLQIRS